MTPEPGQGATAPAQPSAVERMTRLRDEAQQQRQLSAFKQQEMKAVAAAPEPGWFDYTVDVVRGIDNGIYKAIEETGQFLFNDLAEWTGVDKLAAKVEEVAPWPESIPVPTFNDGIALSYKDGTAAVTLPDAGQTQTVPGGITQGVTQFLAGFLGVKKLTGVKDIGTVGNAAVGALTDMVVFDPGDERLSNLVNEHLPTIANPVTEYLAAKPGDTSAEGRFKNALEGLGVGGLIDSLVKTFRGVKKLTDNQRTAKAIAEVKADGTLEIKQGQLFDDAKAADEAQPETKPDAAPEVTPEAKPPAEVEAKPEDLPLDPELATPEILKSRLKLDQRKVNELKQLITSGEYKKADELIGFNADTFDWVKITDDQAVRRMMNATTEVMGELIEKAGAGVESWAVTRARATLEAAVPNTVYKLGADTDNLAARMHAANRIMMSSAQRVNDLVKLTKSGDEAARLDASKELLRQLQVHSLIVAEVRGSRAAIGRALNFMKVLKDARQLDWNGLDQIVSQGELLPKHSSGNFNRLVETLGKLRSVDELNKVVNRTRWESVRDGLTELYINNLLSGIPTHIVNTTVNTLKTIEAPFERALAVGVGTIRRGVGKFAKDSKFLNAERTHLRDVQGMLFGTVQGAKDALRIPFSELQRLLKDKPPAEALKEFFDEKNSSLGTAYKAFVHEKAQLDPVQAYENLRNPAIRITPQEFSKLAAKYPHGAKGLALGVNTVGRMIRSLGGTLIQAEDEVFKAMAYRQELNAIAYREANVRADDLKLDGDVRKKYVREHVATFLENPPDDARVGALDFARYQTFQSELGESMKKVQAIVNKNLALKVIFPFVRTPVNVLKHTMLDRSPLGLLSQKVRDDLAAGGTRGDLAIARLGLGSFLMYQGYEWATSGLITGASPTGYNSEKLDGIPPYSIKVGDEWIQYNRLDGAWGTLIGMAADIHQMEQAYGDSIEDGTEFNERMLQITAMGITAISQNVINKTYLKGVADIGDLISNSASPEVRAERAAKLVTRTASNFVPFASMLRSLEREDDPVAREAFTFIEGIKQGIPGLSKGLAPKRDFLGRIVEEPEVVGGNRAVSPFKKGAESTDPVVKALTELEFDYAMPDKKLDGVRLDAHQYSRMLELRGTLKANGKTMHDALTQLVTSPEWQRLTESQGDFKGSRQELVERTVSAFSSAAKAQMLKEDPDLRAAWIARKKQAASVLSGRELQ